MKILSFGEVLWDVYPDSEYIGGAPLNFAAHFVKCGGEAWMITAVGKDDNLGKKTIAEIEKMGVNTSFVFSSDLETGKCLVTLDDNHIPTYNLLDNVAYDDIKYPDFSDGQFDVLYFGTLSLRNENNRRVLKEIIKNNHFENVFVDVNIRAPFYSDDVVRFVFENATIVKVSDEELPAILSVLGKGSCSVEESVSTICEKFENLKLVIVTKGDKGSYVYDLSNDAAYECKAKKACVVSTVGAGDSYSAAFLAEYLKSKNVTDAMDIATKVSGYVVSQKSAIPHYEINDFM